MAQYEIPAPITINGVATDFEVVKKGLEKVTMNTVKSIPDWIGMIYKPGDFTAYTMKKKVLSGLTDAGAAAAFVRGIALYAAWTTDEQEWTAFQAAFAN